MDLAVYLALTGRRLKAADLLSTGLATHYVPSEELPALEAALVDVTLNKSDKDGDNSKEETDPIAPLLMSFHQDVTPPKEFSLVQDRNEIQKSFGAALKQNAHCRVEDLIASLPDNEFGRLTQKTLSKMSPTSCALTLEGLLRGAAAASLEEDLAMEFRLAQACLRPQADGAKPDFFEGIRAALVDKDQKPQWQSPPVDLDEFFGPIQEEWQLPSSSKL